jgi:hypothetical protein
LLAGGRLLALADTAEQCGQVLGGELPVERPGGAVVAVHEGQQDVAEGAQAWEVAGREDFLLDDGKDDLYFSVLQRKLLTPDDFEGLDELAAQILAFEKHYNAIARPFGWKFTRADLNRLLARIGQHDRHAPHPTAA